MLIIRTVHDLLEYRKNIASDKKIGFVPTMGALHEGHLQLIKNAKKHSDIVIVSIFVNPLQFDDQKDLSVYPQAEKSDLEQLSVMNIDVVFIPISSDIYDQSIDPNSLLEKQLIVLPSIFYENEGAIRSGHFEGVYAVLKRLFFFRSFFYCFSFIIIVFIVVFHLYYPCLIHYISDDTSMS